MHWEQAAADTDDSMSCPETAAAGAERLRPVRGLIHYPAALPAAAAAENAAIGSLAPFVNKVDLLSFGFVL